jgi:hypothetical protein
MFKPLRKFTKKGSVGVTRANLFNERDSHCLYSTKDFLRSVLSSRWVGFHLFQKGRLALNFADRLLQYIEGRRNLVISCGISNRAFSHIMSSEQDNPKCAPAGWKPNGAVNQTRASLAEGKSGIHQTRKVNLC